jgi:Tfp pilus assembly protein FimT
MAVSRTLKRNAGVSLAELVVTVAILIVLFSLAVPAMQNDDRAGNVTRSIVSDASRARSYAKRTWENVTLQVDVTNNRWRSQLQNGTALQTYKSDVDGWIELPPGVSFANIGGGNTDAVFLPTGRTSSDAAFAIVQGSNQWHIVIKSLSGLITATPQ